MNDAPQKKPDPIEDVRKGLELLLRAATTAVNSLPTDKLETAVVSGVKEVGRAIENVAHAIDKEVFKNGKPVYGTTKPKDPLEGAPTYQPGTTEPAAHEPAAHEKVLATQQPPSPDAPPAPDSPENPDAPVPPPPPGEPNAGIGGTDTTKPV